VQYQIPEVVSGACDSFDLLWGLVGRPLPLPVLATTTPAGEDFRVLTNGPGRKRSFIYKELLARIKSAQKRIWLVTPYFSPSPKLVRYLRDAAKRGVDCQVIIPQQSDKIATNLSARSAFTRLLESEVTIRLYQDDLHAKYFVIDGWGSVGSCNMDYLSFFLNHEMNVATENEDFVGELANQFKKDCGNADRITKEEWDRAGWWETAKATAGHILRPVA
jgi:cardiolipin synthase